MKIYKLPTPKPDFNLEQWKQKTICNTDIFVFNDGGRKKAGFKGFTGDCAVRSLAICLDLPYKEVYDTVNEFCKLEKPSKRRRGISNARTGIHTYTVKKIAIHYGLKWVPKMTIGSGCTTHVKEDELPKGRIILNLSRHFAAMIDGKLQDIYDCSRNGTRCVYGYWHL